MLYAAKCYWPGVTTVELEALLARVPQVDGEATYTGSLVFSDDDLVLCLYDGPSRATVMAATRRAHIPCERIMESAWLPAPGSPISTPGGLR
jgi:hypothetical protein